MITGFSPAAMDTFSLADTKYTPQIWNTTSASYWVQDTNTDQIPPKLQMI